MPNANEVATVDAASPPAVQDWNDERKQLLKASLCDGFTDPQFELFLMQCQRTGLDPFSRQVCAFRQGNKLNIITQIDGLRLIANRTGNYAPGKEPSFVESPEDKLVSATAYVMKYARGEWHEVAATCFAKEYARWTTGRDGKPTGPWIKMPHVMLAKCAEAAALRRAFPNELSGLYSHDEMDQAQEIAVEATTIPMPQSNQQEAQTEPRRGAVSVDLPTAEPTADVQAEPETPADQVVHIFKGIVIEVMERTGRYNSMDRTRYGIKVATPVEPSSVMIFGTFDESIANRARGAAASEGFEGFPVEIHYRKMVMADQLRNEIHFMEIEDVPVDQPAAGEIDAPAPVTHKGGTAQDELPY